MDHVVRRLLVTIFLLAAMPAGWAQPLEQVWPILPETSFPELKALLDSALRQSPRMIARHAEDAVAEANRTVAHAGQLPSVAANVQFNGWQRDVRADLSRPAITQKFYYNVNLVQPIFHWGELQNNSRIGELQLQASQGQSAESYRQLVQELRSLYLQLVIKKASLARARFAQQLAVNQLRLAEEKLKTKVAAGAEVMGSKLNLRQLTLAMDRQQEDYEAARRLLAKLSGADPIPDERVPDVIPRLVAPMAALEALLTPGTPPATGELRLLRDQIEMEQLTYKNATTRLRPKLNLVVGANQDEQSYTSNIAVKYKVQSYYVGTQLNWTIFDGFAARGQIASSLARRRQLERNYREQSAGVTELARSQFTQLGFSARAMDIADLYLSMSESGIGVKKQEIDRGQAAQTDLDAVQLALLDSRTIAFNSRFDFLLRVTEFLATLAQDPALDNFSRPNP